LRSRPDARRRSALVAHRFFGISLSLFRARQHRHSRLGSLAGRVLSAPAPRGAGRAFFAPC
jgi:hypothetical protein